LTTAQLMVLSYTLRLIIATHKKLSLTLIPCISYEYAMPWNRWHAVGLHV